MISPNFLDHSAQEFSALVDESLQVSDVNLTNCDREPIHIPNAIQPHGLLVVCDCATLEIIQVSANIEGLTGHTPPSLIGQTLQALFDPGQSQTLLDQLSGLQQTRLSKPLRVIVQTTDQSGLEAYALMHYDEPYLTLELEPVTEDEDLNSFNFLEQIKAPIERLQRTQTLSELCESAVEEIQQMTGFDRVMTYRFHPDGSGSVIAESAKDDAVPYLGLRYPSTDIPSQAKKLYSINWLRIIPDVSYDPVPMVDLKETPSPLSLDMSHIGLRSVSPMHVEYLHNMGVNASLSISLMQEGKLWGLIACHHESPKHVPLPLRLSCELIGQIMSSELVAKERFEVIHQRQVQKRVLTRIEEAILSAQSLPDAMDTASVSLLKLVNATGVAYFEQNMIKLLGETPSLDHVQDLLTKLKPHFQENSVYSTPRLSHLFPEAEAYASQASGVLGLSISKTQNIYLLWFRPELPQCIHWAGNPHKPASLDENGNLYLSPRQSFERWVETVLLSCEPWSAADLETALELRSSIIGLVLQKADELAKVNLELARSNEDLASFAYVASHDLKAPLRAIANLACWLQEDLAGQVSPDSQMQLDLLQSRVYRMHDMIEGLLQYSRVGDFAKSIGVVSIPELLDDIIDSLSPSPSIQVVRPQVTTLYETNKILLKQVLTNLLSNAIKYVNRPDALICIQCEESDSGLRFSVIDNGPGIAQEYHEKIFQMFQTLHSRDEIESTGIGLAIVKKVVTTQGGTLTLKSEMGRGSTFSFTWPNALPVDSL